jgi:uncharacterized Zn finger protein
MYIEVYCPDCGGDRDHIILSQSHDMLVRCSECGSVRHIPIIVPPTPVAVKAIVSEETTSRVCQIELMPDEDCALGERHVAVCGDDEYVGVEITGIEIGPKRVKRAKGSEISTLWTRKIEEVMVRISIHDGWKTVPLFINVNGEEPFIVGESYQFGKRRVRIAQIKLRDGGVLRKDGWKTVARRIKRIYGYPS